MQIFKSREYGDNGKAEGWKAGRMESRKREGLEDNCIFNSR